MLKSAHKIGIAALLLLPFQSAYSELTLPGEMAPLASQLQTALLDKIPSHPVVPVALVMVSEVMENLKPGGETVTPKEKEEIGSLVRRILDDKLHVVVVSDAGLNPYEDPIDGRAKNFVIAEVASKYSVKVAVSPSWDTGLLTAANIPVGVTVNDAQAKAIDNKHFAYKPNKQEAFLEDVENFLAQHLAQAPEPAPVATPQPEVAPAGDAMTIKVWMESKSGSTEVQAGSQVAFYFQANTKGYVSLYHFGAGGSVQRIYPGSDEPFNFVDAGRLYRYPAKDYLSVTGPVGEERLKAIITRLPSNISRESEGLSYRSAPLYVIPTHYPVLFASGDITEKSGGLSRFFSLPSSQYAESHLVYTVK